MSYYQGGDVILSGATDLLKRGLLVACFDSVLSTTISDSSPLLNFDIAVNLR